MKFTCDKNILLYSQISAIKKCREPVILAMQVCLSDQADQDLEIFDEAISAAVDFMCYKGGERIASIVFRWNLKYG